MTGGEWSRRGRSVKVVQSAGRQHVIGMPRTPLPPEGEIVRRHDPERYFTSLFAPPGQREALWALYAFNHELARAREAVREPFAALIRLQWWREVVEGARRRHEVATPLGAALDAGGLHAADLMGMIDAREAETEPMETLAAFEAYLLGTAGGVMVAAGRTLGEPAPERLRHAGAACGAMGVLRSVAAVARQGRCVLPEDLLRDAGSSTALVIAKGEAPDAVREQVKALARRWLEPMPRVSRTVLPAVLPVAIARLRLRGGTGAGRLAILSAVAIGRP